MASIEEGEWAMHRIGAATLAFSMVVLGSPDHGSAQKRVALVVGNSAYQHTPALDNPKNDATDVAAALKRVGFNLVEGFDLTKADFDRKVRDFSAALRGAEVGVFFYAGHGLQVAGHNYLVPIDAKLEDADSLEWEMLRLDVVHRIMERQTSTNILFLDACRNNPLARNLARAMGTRSAEIGRGLAAVESGVGTLISFSTQPGNVALDGRGRNSPFASSLVKRIASSNEDLSALLIDVRNDVRKETENKQIPWEHSALTGRFYFNAPAKPASPVGAPPARLSEAAEAWSAAERTTSIPALEAFITRYKDTFYAELARARIEELKKQQFVVATPPRTSQQPTPETKQETTTVSGYEIVKLSSITGRVVGSLQIKIDAGNPDAGIAACAKLCDANTGCSAFDISIVYSKCTLYGSVEKMGSLGGYISGVRASPVPVVAVSPSPSGCDGLSAQVAGERRCLKPKESFKDCPECPEMVVVPAGEFTMGSPDSEFGRDTDEGPQHRVTFSSQFAVGKFAVTFAEWDACIAQGGCNGYRPPDKGWGRGNRPVINVSWDDAKAYVNWLSKATAKTYRLLSETEREYMTRAGTTTPFWWGSSMASEANHAGAVPYPPGSSTSQTRLQPAQQTLPVHSFNPNPWGLYQVHGNVSEWVEDCWNNSYRGAPSDGSAWISGDCSRRVLRGGSWSDSGAKLRSADRDTQATIFRSTALGFRVARTLSP